MEIKNMVAVGATGTSNEMKEQCEKHKKFVGHFLSKETFMTRGDTHDHENNKVFSYQRTCAKKGKCLLGGEFFILPYFFFFTSIISASFGYRLRKMLRGILDVAAINVSFGKSL